MVQSWLLIPVLISHASSAGVWVPSSTQPNIEYYYHAQCIAFSPSSGTSACKSIYPTATLASVNNAVVQSHIASNVIDGSPTSGGCSSGFGMIGTGGSYISKTIGVGGTISWLNGDPNTSDLMHYSTYPRLSLPEWPGLFLSTIDGHYGAAMDFGWSDGGKYYGAAVLCQRNTLDTVAPSASPTHRPSSEPTLEPTLPQPTPPSAIPTPSPTFQPTLNPSRNPSESPSNPPTITPTSSPTKHPTSEPTKSPTFVPTDEPSHEPSKEPTKNPSQTPTKAPSKSPTFTPTTRQNGLVFVCGYDDMDYDEYIVDVTLSQYASLMADAVLSSVAELTHYPTDYNETESVSYLRWKRGGIFDFHICSIFTDIKLDDLCPEYDIDSDDIDSDIDVKYVAIGLFGVDVAEELQLYKAYLQRIMTGDEFKGVLNIKMNDAFQDLTGESDNFKAVIIEMFTLQNLTDYNANDSIETQTDKKNTDADAYTVVIIVLLVLALIVVALGATLYYVKGKQNMARYPANPALNYEVQNNLSAKNIYNEDVHIQPLKNHYNDNSHDDDVAKCKIVQRVLDLVISYETWNEFPDGDLKWSSIQNVFAHYELMQLIDDYNHCLSKHEEDKDSVYMAQYLLLRVTDLCTKNHIFDHIGNDRKYLTEKWFDVNSEDVFKLEMLDKIHIHFFHAERKKKAVNNEQVELEEVRQNDDDMKPDADSFAEDFDEDELDKISDGDHGKKAVNNQHLELEEIRQNDDDMNHDDDLFAKSFGDEELDKIIDDERDDDEVIGTINETAHFSNAEKEGKHNDDDSVDMIRNDMINEESVDLDDDDEDSCSLDRIQNDIDIDDEDKQVDNQLQENHAAVVLPSSLGTLRQGEIE